MSSRNHRLGFKRRSMPLMLNDTDETKPKTRRRNEVEVGTSRSLRKSNMPSADYSA